MKTDKLAPSSADIDPLETSEWVDAMRSLTSIQGSERAQFIMAQLEEVIRNETFTASGRPFSAYRNSIPLEAQGIYPGDLELEQRITSINRWNALAMVMRANKAYGGLGGHIASYASAAEIFETGLNHFFRASTPSQGGDLVYFQPHSAPGIYARAYLEGRLSAQQLSNYRQEISGNGLCSYPHPWLMPDFWQFPTGSMGIGPINAIYQARYMRYLQHRGLTETQDRHVWGVFGDGEMDEPESIAGLTLAAREGLDNVTFVINCNLQRLDGPVRGNSQIIQELESLFIGAGWNVLKVLWGSEWDALFARDTEQVLLRRFAETVDGEYQDLGSKDGDYNRSKFFDADPASAALVAHMTDAEINKLTRGGHDLRKLHAAFSTALRHKGKPTVILAKTKKGFGMGGAGESRMMSHQAKSLDMEALCAFRDRFKLPLSDDDLTNLNFYHPGEDSAEVQYLREKRQALGGPLPKRKSPGRASDSIIVPKLETYANFALKAEGKAMSTTMAAVRMLGGLLKDKSLGARVVPIVADEARTFGMDNLFRQVGIYSPVGQTYRPEDADSMLYYKEATDGQLLEEGINEAGALSSWAAAATSYSVHDQPMLPFYIYYSMFGFQRVGDLIWAAADQRARGFLLGATAGRTTLSGEGLQHQDGSSQLIASTVPNCRAYDPAYAYEVAVIMHHGMEQMMQHQVDEFYYITLMNENSEQPSSPDNVTEGIIKGLYKISHWGKTDCSLSVRLIGSGTILNEVIEAAEILHRDYGISSEIFSATSFSELAREARSVERQNRLLLASAEQSYVEKCLPGDNPVIAATDYVVALPQLIAPYVSARFVALGTDGFGRSDQRAVLRDFFEVDSKHIVIAALESLVNMERLDRKVIKQALNDLAVTPQVLPPWLR
jgi:pyruvate dehydrogenase E1 component